MNFYRFENKKMPWGDYGNILLTGFIWFDDKTEKYYTERCGYFMPPVFQDFWRPYIVISDNLKIKLDKSGLSGFETVEVNKQKIINIDWINWNFDKKDPKIYPAGGEPDNYFYTRKHNEKLSEELGKIWVIQPSFSTIIIPLIEKESCVVENTWKGQDIFKSEYYDNCIAFSDKAKKWFLENSEGYANFVRINSKVGTKEEITNWRNNVEKRKKNQEKAKKLTTKDWQLYHRLINEANKIFEIIPLSKSEKTKSNRSKKAFNLFVEAKELYRLQEEEQNKYEKLKKKLNTVANNVYRQ